MNTAKTIITTLPLAENNLHIEVHAMKKKSYGFDFVTFFISLFNGNEL